MPASSMRRGAWQLTLEADRLVRLYVLFYTATWPLLGAASISGRVTPRELAVLLGVSLCFHVYAYVLNDVIDLPIDRTSPERRHDFLVRGAITPRQALLVALLQLPIALGLTALLEAAPRAYAALVASFALMGVYNVWGKRGPVPPLTDFIQGLSWGGLAVYAVLARGAEPTPLTWLVAAYGVVYTMFINGIHGSFRDLVNDLARGARTTAIFFGARPSRLPGEHETPLALAVYAWIVLAVLAALNAVIAIRNDLQYGAVAWTLTAAAVAALNLWAMQLHPRVLRPSGATANVAWRLQIYIMLSVLPIAFAGSRHVAVLLSLLILNVFALILFDCTAAVTRWAWLAIAPRRRRESPTAAPQIARAE